MHRMPEVEPTLSEALSTVGLEPTTVLDAMADGVVIVDRAGTIRFVNARVVELTGYPRDALLGSSVEMLVPEPVREEHVHLREATQQEEGLHRPMGTGRDIVLRRADGVEIPVDIALSQLDLLVVASVRDARTTRATLTALNEERRRAAILSERARIARDLHDGIIQQLFAVGLGLRAAKATDLAQQRGDAVDRIDDAIRDLRAYVSGMHEDTASRSLVGSLTEVITQLRVASSAPIEPMIDLRVARELTRHNPVLVNFAREALTNAIRHSGAKRIELALRAEGPDAVLEIIDDGHGFDPAAVGGTGAGLPNFQARALAIGARCVVASTPGSGTRIALYVPLRRTTREQP